MKIHFRALVPVLAISALCWTGCGSATVSPSAADEVHLDHHVPAHKPVTFSAAIDALRSRARALRKEGVVEHSDRLSSELAEIRDIVDWLPELAADSDMGKADWDQVNARTDELRGSLQKMIQEFASVHSETPAVEEFLGGVSGLEPFVSKTGQQRRGRENNRKRVPDRNSENPSSSAVERRHAEGGRYHV